MRKTVNFHANKTKEEQFLMRLLIDKEGIPLSYELFEGNTLEGKPLAIFNKGKMVLS